jgi:cysteine-rich repeat protein
MAWLKGLPFVMAALAIGCDKRSLDPGPGTGGGGTGSSGFDAGGDGNTGLDTRLDLPPIGVEVPHGGCGNGVLDPGEQCDDGNKAAGDGCSSICQIPRGWTCTHPGTPCTIAEVCGDAVLAASEACDDGNVYGGDGCSADCRNVEVGWYCPVNGRRCVPICGDGRTLGLETCDDDNVVSGDGCSAICLTEPSTARCGDGVMSGAEECDDGNANVPPDTDAYNYCTTACRLASFCGDGVLNGPEECDSGPGKNSVSYGNRDGCGPGCRFPHFCGDGIVDESEGEQCDLGLNNGVVGQCCTVDCKILLDC